MDLDTAGHPNARRWDIRRRISWGVAALLVAWAAACGEGGGGGPVVPDPPTPPTRNRAPEAVGSIPPVGLAAGDDATIEVSSYFNDPDGDALSYAAESSDVAVATASVSGSTVTITAVAPGTATVTVTARDPAGLSATQNAAVTVERANRAPGAVRSIPPVGLAAGDDATFEVSSYFNDPDGDALSYAAESSDVAVASVSVSGAALTITGVTPGTTTVTVTALDPGGLSAPQNVDVTVSDGSNRAPEGTLPFLDVTLPAGVTITFNVLSYFSDPDGDRLTYSSRTSNPDVTTVAVSGSALSLTAVSEGHATVDLTARDPGNLPATLSFGVNVAKGPPAAVGDIPEDTLEVGGRPPWTCPGTSPIRTGMRWPTRRRPSSNASRESRYPGAR